MPGLENVRDYVDRLCASGIRITEKRKYLGLIQDQLNADSVCRKLSEAYEKNADFSWANVFEVGKRLAEEEFTRTKKSLSNANDESIETTQRRRSSSGKTNAPSLDCFNFFKWVVSKFSEAVIHGFPATEVAEFCFGALQDDNEEVRRLYSLDAAFIISKHVLCDVQRYCELKANDFRTIIKLCFDILLDGESTIADPSYVSEVLKAAFSAAGTYYDAIPVKQICKLMQELAEHFKKSVAGKRSWENLVASANSFLETYGFDRRATLCEFGEHFSVIIISFYDFCSDLSLPREMTKFFRLQFILHNPRSATAASNVEFQTESWMAVVKDLYQRLISDIVKLPLKQAGRRRTTDNALTPDALDLAARVLCVIFGSADFVQTASTSRIEMELDTSLCTTQAGRKRQCVETGWNFILNMVKENRDNEISKAWLQITEHLLSEFGTHVTSGDTIRISCELISIVDSIKRPDILRVVLKVLRATILLLADTEEKSKELAQLARQLHPIVRRLIASRPVQFDAIHLLTTLVVSVPDIRKGGDTDLAQTLGVFVSEVKQESLDWIRAILTKCDFNERLLIDGLTTGNGITDQRYSFRLSLIHWLLTPPRFLTEEGSEDENSSNSVWALKWCRPAHLAIILCLLVTDKPATAPFSTGFDASTNENDYVKLERQLENIWCLDGDEPDHCSLGNGKIVESAKYVQTVAENLIHNLERLFISVIDGIGNLNSITMPQFKHFVDHWCLHWSCSILFESMFTSDESTFQRLSALDDRYWNVITAITDDRKEAKLIFMERVLETLAILRQHRFRMKRNPALERLIKFLYNVAEKEFNVYGSPRKQRRNDEESILVPAIDALGMALAFACRNGRLTETRIPDICRDFVGILSESPPVDFSTLIRALDQVGRFFHCDRGVSTAFLATVRTLLSENRRSNIRKRQLLHVLEPLASWAATNNDHIKREYLELVLSMLSEAEGFSPKLNPSLYAAGLKCILRFLQEGNITEGVLSLDDLLKLLCGSFNVNHSVSLALPLMIKTVHYFDTATEAYSAFIKETKQEENRRYLSLCFTKMVCKTMTVNPTFHAPCLLQLVKASRERCLHEPLCTTILRHHFGIDLHTIMNENLDVVLSYWLRQYGTNFDRFPYQLWNESSVEKFLNAHLARLIPLSTLVLNSSEVNTFLAQFNGDSPDRENVANEMASYSLAVVAVGHSTNRSTPLEFFNILKDGDVQDGTLECIVDSICVLCRWTVFDRPVIPGTVELDRNSWMISVERLIRMAGCSNFNELVNVLPERSIPKLLISLRRSTVRSFYKARWLEALNLINGILDFHPANIDLRSFIAREILATASAVLRRAKDRSDAEVAMRKVQQFCDFLHPHVGEEIAEHLAIPLTSVMSVTEKFSDLQDRATRALQYLVPFIPASKRPYYSLLLPTKLQLNGPDHMEIEDTLDAPVACHTLAEMQPWMLMNDQLELLNGHLANIPSSMELDPCDGSLLARKLFRLVSSGGGISGMCLKTLSRLYVRWPQTVLEAFMYSWNYKDSLENAFLSILDECIQSDDGELICVATECLLRMIDLVPAVRSSIENNKNMAIYRILLPQKDNVLNSFGFHTPISVNGPATNDRIRHLVLALCRHEETGCCEFLESVERLLLHDIRVAECLLPYVVEYAVKKNESYAAFVAETFNQLLKEFSRLREGSDSVAEEFVGAVRCVLGTVKRLQHAEIRRPGLESYRLVELDYILLANALVACGMPSAAPVLVEIGMESMRNSSPQSSQDLNYFYGDNFLSEVILTVPTIQSTLLDSLIAQGDAEAIEGLGDLGMENARARILLCEMDGDISKIISMYSSIENVDDVLPWHTVFVVRFQQNNDKGVGSITDSEYSCAWKLCEWDTFDQSKVTNPNGTFNRLIYETVKNFEVDGSSGVSSIWDHLTAVAGRRCINPYIFLQQSILATDLDNAFSAVRNGRIEGIFETYNHQRLDFDDRVWLLHAVVNRVLHCRSAHLDLDQVTLAQHYTPICCDVLSLCRRKSLHHIGLQVAQTCKHTLQALFSDEPKDVVNSDVQKIVLQEIELLWEFREHTRASGLLKSLTERLEKASNKNDPELLCALIKCYVLLNDLKGHGNVADSVQVADKLAQMAKRLQNTSRNESSSELSAALGSANLAMANFANRKYQELSDYMSSPLFAAKKSHIEKFRSELRNVQMASTSRSPLVGASVEQRTYIQVSRKKCDVDENEVSDLIRQRTAHLVAALTSYLNVLIVCNDHDVLIFRVMSLWFENPQIKEATNVVEKLSKSISSHKWLVVFQQVASRLAGNNLKGGNNGCSKSIREIVSKVVADHPFHTFYILYTMTMAEPRDEMEKQRQKAAMQILSNALSGPNGTVFKEMERLIKAFVTLHEWKPKEKKMKKEGEIPYDQPILSFVTTIPLPTMTIEPSPTCDYSSVPRISKFENGVRLMSGLSAPKRLTCLCSDGVRRRFLLKGGQDDPRQDAIMEQLFRILNIRLQRKERECGSYRGQYGSMRTYNVVPLSSSPSSSLGLIENCDGCLSLGDFMLGEDCRGGARSIYYPDQPSYVIARQQILDASKDTIETRLRAFLRLCEKIRPVFRHFFYERFPDPNEWYQRRREYTISVAVSSMVGHIIGLSDRHVQNIMIDENTGEVVHIDHGMAFEQGRLLPTPETVPFRLTRDMIDPMGVCGINGVFRRSCVRTMTALRESKDILMPILSVLLHDPVSQWTLSASKAQSKQPEKQISEAEKAVLAATKNVHAERAIVRICDKLNGRENTELFDVDGQVEHLISVARDPKNLCLMYGGWQAYF